MAACTGTMLLMACCVQQSEHSLVDETKHLYAEKSHKRNNAPSVSY